MSDTSQGPGWWQASDLKWYPPEQFTGAAPVQVAVKEATPKMSPAIWVVLGASALVALGSLLPWESLGIVSANGTSGDGVITLFASLLTIGAVVLFARGAWRPKLVRSAAGLLILLCLATSLYDVIHISGEQISLLGSTISPSVGSGLWLCFIGSMVAAVALGVDFRNSSRSVR